MLRADTIVVVRAFVGSVSVPTFVSFICRAASLPFHLRRINSRIVFTYMLRSLYLFYATHSFLISHVSASFPDLLFFLTCIRLRPPGQIAYHLCVAFIYVLRSFMRYLHFCITSIHALHSLFFLMYQPPNLESP